MTEPLRSGLLSFVTRTPTHLGGGEARGDVDLAIVRECNTGLPMWPSASLKGVFRANSRPDDVGALDGWKELFGPEPGDPIKHEGIFQPEDARLIALPVATPAAPIAWATSPFLLMRFAQACAEAGVVGLPPVCSGAVELNDGHCWARSGLAPQDSYLRLDDLIFAAECGPQDYLNSWAWVLERWFAARLTGWKTLFSANLVIVPDIAMKHLAALLEVRARIKRATSQDRDDSNLWYEEYLPDETLMWAEWSLQPLLDAKTFKPDLAAAAAWVRCEPGQDVAGVKALPQRLRVGGKASVGKGRVEARWLLGLTP